MALSGNVATSAWTAESGSTWKVLLKWTATQNVVANTSTIDWEIVVSTGSSGYVVISELRAKINGSEVYYRSHDNHTNGYNGTVLARGTKTVTHENDGNKNVAMSIEAGIYSWAINKTGSSTFTLNKIDRTAPTVSATVSNITASSAKIKVSSSTTSNKWWYSLDDGASWVNFDNTEGTSKETTVTGLTPNTTYKIKVCARKKSNAVDGYSGTTSAKTLGGSVLSSVSAFTADASTAKITLSATVYDTSYTHTLVIKNGSTTVLTISGKTLKNGSNTITLTAAQRSTVLSAMSAIKSFSGTFTLKTYSGSTQIGTDSSKTATVQTTEANSAPTFSGFTYKDANATAAAVTGNDQILIQAVSSLKVTATAATAKNGATISSYSVVAGSSTASSTETEITVGQITTSGTVPVIVTAIDSRGYTTSVTVNITVIKYESVNFTAYTIRRVNEVEDATQVHIGGELTPVTVGGENKNTLVYLYYRYWKTSGTAPSSWNVITASTAFDDDSFSFDSDEWISLDADYSYYVQFLVADKLKTDAITLTVPQGTPLMSFRRKKVGVNNRNPQAALDVVGSVMMNGFNVLGLVAALGSDEDLNSLVSGGIYTQALNANASTSKHYPKAIAGFLEVMTNPSGYVMQRYTAYDNSAVYVRTRYNNTWYAWKSLTLTTV